MCKVLSFVIICVSLMSFRQLTLKLTLKDSLDESSCIFVCHMLTALEGGEGGVKLLKVEHAIAVPFQFTRRFLRVSKNISEKFH